MKIAIGLPLMHDDPRRALAAARDAEAAGAWGVWTFDNQVALKDPSLDILDGWGLLGAVAASTTTTKVISLVTRAGLRHPAVVARMAAVVQGAAHGRFILGLGAGDDDSRAAELALGIDADEPPRVDALRETARLVRHDAMPVRPSGEAPEIWVGGTTKVMRELAIEVGDAWHAWGLSPEEFAERAAAIRATKNIECWWGGYWRPGLEAEYASADGITWMLPSKREHERDRMLGEL